MNPSRTEVSSCAKAFWLAGSALTRTIVAAVFASLLAVANTQAAEPSWYIVSALDGAIAPDLGRFFAKRMKATTTELNASHVSMLSKPNEVAAVVIDAASKAPH